MFGMSIGRSSFNLVVSRVIASPILSCPLRRPLRLGSASECEDGTGEVASASVMDSWDGYEFPRTVSGGVGRSAWESDGDGLAVVMAVALGAASSLEAAVESSVVAGSSPCHHLVSR